MTSSAPRCPAHAAGYPAALTELHAQTAHIEPDLVLGLYALLRAAGLTITYSECDVLSGHAGRFIYDRVHPECAQLAFVPPVDTLMRAVHATWKEVTPSDPGIAYVVLREWLQTGTPAIARLREPLLVFGITPGTREESIAAARVWSRLAEASISVNECERDYWRVPLDEGNVLIRVEHAPPRIEHWTELIPATVHRTVRAWHAAELAGCAAGGAAYRTLIADLANAAVDFTQPDLRAWMGAALWRQWTARSSLHEFFERIAPRYGGRERAALTKAAFCYGQCVAAWRNWAALLGPTWDVARQGFDIEWPAEFLARWRSRKQRLAAAQRVDEARAWEEKAVQELTKTLR